MLDDAGDPVRLTDRGLLTGAPAWLSTRTRSTPGPDRGCWTSTGGPGAGTRPRRPGCSWSPTDGAALLVRSDRRRVAGRGGVRLMGWNNPNVPWSELERALSGRAAGSPAAARCRRSGPGSATARPRAAAARPARRSPRPTPSCTATPRSASWTARPPRSSWSPRRSRLGLDALAITDHDGLYGIVRFAEAAARGRAAHPVRRRAVPRAARAAAGRPRPGRRAPAGAGPRPGGLPPAVHPDQPGPAGRRREGPAGLRPRRPRRQRRTITG